MRISGRVCGLFALLLSGACGGGGNGAPTSPSPGALSAPTNFRITLQRVHWTANEVQLAWSGTAPSYRVFAGSMPRGSDLLTADTTATTHTWMAPREASTYYVRVVAVRGDEISASPPELPVFTMDLRNVVDALFFRSGPMADNPNNALDNPQAGLWAEGARLSVLVSNEAGETSRTNAQRFVDDYQRASGDRVTASVQATSDDFRSLEDPRTLAPFTIVVRLLVNGCGATANILACANLGPTGVGPNASIVTLNQPAGTSAMSHEMGHAYGMGHVRVTGAVRPELDFLMNPTLLSQQLTEPERTAIAAAWDGGLRAGWRRNQALAAGLVLPYPNPNMPAVWSGLPPPSRDEVRCRIVDGASTPSTR